MDIAQNQAIKPILNLLTIAFSIIVSIIMIVIRNSYSSSASIFRFEYRSLRASIVSSMTT
ncbi:hypothetical protein HMPREF1576_00991 [Gardnerella pickettii JCP7719]|uniref:Uncharacterized protein n=1 Tax=Gardnerella pickettii JCP7719 TaxID=1261061 RepID=S4GLU3_9BIFI|nr:hypothetical protein HMPREF1576_00991 [Gardnerella pickettii JCP7719]